MYKLLGRASSQKPYYQTLLKQNVKLKPFYCPKSQCSIRFGDGCARAALSTILPHLGAGYQLAQSHGLFLCLHSCFLACAVPSSSAGAWRLQEPSDRAEVPPLPEGRLAPGSWASCLQAGARVRPLKVRDSDCEHLDVHVPKAHAYLQGAAPV